MASRIPKGIPRTPLEVERSFTLGDIQNELIDFRNKLMKREDILREAHDDRNIPAHLRHHYFMEAMLLLDYRLRIDRVTDLFNKFSIIDKKVRDKEAK